MRFYGKDGRSRVMITRLLIKIREQPECSRRIGAEDVSHFHREVNEKRKREK